VIELIQSKLGDNHYTFVFDAWGSQEDLTRKSFLEQLINRLFDKKFLNDSKKWKDLESKLLSKTSKKHKQIFPKIKSFWIFISIGIVLLSFLPSFYEYVLEDKDIFPFSVGVKAKPFLAIYALPIVFLSIGFIMVIVNYFEERKKNKNKAEKEKESRLETLGKIFYWFNGNDIESTELENILEDEPSVRRFREYFKEIEDEINGKGDLIIVFDNLDRLNTDKVKSLWSSIHTFFAEDYKPFNSWVIVPYDRIKLEEHFGDGYGGFISKTFSINFRITPPVVTEWEVFLKDKLKEAFGDKLIDDIEKEYIVKLFDILSTKNTIKPRQIINYVNNLVSMYKQWKEEIEEGNLKLRYLSLFILCKDKITTKPNEAIIERNYLQNVEVLFENDEDLDTSMSMIVFGVKKDLADEVLLDRQIKQALRSGNKETIESLIGHKAFESYFLRANKLIPLNEKIKGLVAIYETIKNVFSKNMMNTFWKDFANGIIHVDGQFERFNDNHKSILVNTNPSFGKKILIKLFSTLKQNFTNTEVQNKYYAQIKEVENYLEENKINIKLSALISKTTFTPESYLDFISSSKDDYKKYKIECDKDELIDSFYSDDEIDADYVVEKLEELNILKEEFSIRRIIKSIKEEIEEVVYTDEESLNKYLNILKTLSKKPLNLSLSNAYYAQLSTAKLNQNEVNEDAVCIAISNFDTAYANSNHFRNMLTALTEEQIEKLSQKIEWYFEYGELVKLLTINTTVPSYPKLKDIAVNLTHNSYGISRLNVNWALEEFDNISTKVFDDDKENIEIFAKKLNGWIKHYDSKIEDISTGFFKFIKHQELELIGRITKDSLVYINELSKEDILVLFKEENKNSKILEELINNDLINKFTNEFYSAYDDYMKDIAKEVESVPDIGFWDELIEKLDGRKLISTYTSIRDILINGGEANENLLYFFEKGLINYGNLHKKPESSTLKIVIPMIESDKNFDLFLDNQEKLLEVINVSNEHKETAKGELQLRLNSKKYKENDKMISVAKALKLESDSEEQSSTDE